jgi:hypothetical protein
MKSDLSDAVTALSALEADALNQIVVVPAGPKLGNSKSLIRC